MSDVRLAVEQVTRSGLDPTLNGSLNIADTHQIRNDGEVFLNVINGGASSTNVTIITPGQIGGNAIADRVVAVANGANKLIGPFPPSIYNNQDGDMEMTLSYVTSVTVAVLHRG